MKVSKVFGCVIGLHFGVIAILLIQPGCRTHQPPTQIYTQEQTMKSYVQEASRTPVDLIPATRQGSGEGLDAAFNAGFDDGDYGPGDRAESFGEFDDVTPIDPIDPIAPIDPIDPLSDGRQTVDVAGTSYETYTVKKGDNLWSIAKRYNVSLNELYSANSLNENSVIRVGQQIEIPVEGGTATVDTVDAEIYQPSSFNQGSTEYTVKRGDTLSKIANQYDTSVRAIKAANGQTSDTIRVGETLVIPVAEDRGRSSSGSSSTSTNPGNQDPSSSAASGSNVSSPGTRTHTVQSGEYPGTIARRYGMTTGELLALNGITDPRKLQVGQKLKVNGSGSADNIDSRTETVTAPSAASRMSRALSSANRASNSSTRSTSTSSSAGNDGPVEIRVIEADPLVEGEAAQIESNEMFEGAVEIPVIRLED